MAFFSVVRVMHAGTEITPGRTELEGSTAEIHCQCLPFEQLSDAAVVHWNGRFHQKICVVRGVHATFVKLAVTVSHLWQWTCQQASQMSQVLLTAPKPDTVPDIPYPSLPCADSCAQLKSAAGSTRVDCPFPDCEFSTMHALMRGHIGGHFLQGHRWEGQKDGDPHLFCLFCGSCDGQCLNKVRNGRVDSTCALAYPKLRVSSAQKSSKSNPCSNVPVRCPVQTCQKWPCSYALEHHIKQCHPQMAPPYTPVPDGEKEQVLNRFGTVRNRNPRPDTPCLPHPSPTTGPAPQLSANSDSGSGSTSTSATSSSSSSTSTSTSATSGASSASDYIPSGAASEGVSDAAVRPARTRASKRKHVAGKVRPKPKSKGKQRQGEPCTDSESNSTE